MNYFYLKSSSDPKVIGVKNGVFQGEIKWKLFKNKSSKNIIESYFSLSKYRSNNDEIEKQDFTIEYVAAYKSAKMTDFFSFTPALWGVDFFISTRVKHILETFRLPKHCYVPVKIFQNETKYDYWALYIPVSYREDSFVFPDSVFYDGSLINRGERKEINTIEEFRENLSLKCDKLYLDKKSYKKYDLFSSLYSGYGYHISEQLKNKLEESKFTGFVIKENLNPQIIFQE